MCKKSQSEEPARQRLLLLLTTRTYKAGAFLEAARQLGVVAAVASQRPQTLATKNPGGHLTLSFSQPEEATRAILEFSREYPLSAVVAADDDGTELASLACAALGLPHNPIEAVRSARNKHRMRQILAQTELPGPAFQWFSSRGEATELVAQVSFPCVLKPLALSGSQGVIRSDTPAELIAAFRRVANLLHRIGVADSEEAGGGILVEDFIPGAEVAVEGMLSAGELRVLAVFDKPDPLDGPYFEETIYVTPSRLSAQTQGEIARTTARAAAALGLREGPLHAELRINATGCWILEMAPRSIGGLCARTLRFSGGTSLEELILRHALGHEVDAVTREECAAGVMMIPIPRAGTLHGVTGKEEAEKVAGIEEIRLTIPVGHEVVPLPEGNRYLGFVFARSDTPGQVERSLRQAHRRLEFDIS